MFRKSKTMCRSDRMTFPEHTRFAWGNDLDQLVRAKERMARAASNPGLPWFVREMAMELLKTGSLLEYENVRVAWAELSEALATLSPINFPDVALPGPVRYSGRNNRQGHRESEI